MSFQDVPQESKLVISVRCTPASFSTSDTRTNCINQDLQKLFVAIFIDRVVNVWDVHHLQLNLLRCRRSFKT